MEETENGRDAPANGNAVSVYVGGGSGFRSDTCMGQQNSRGLSFGLRPGESWVRICLASEKPHLGDRG